jgi:hypothetical protein
MMTTLGLSRRGLRLSAPAPTIGWQPPPPPTAPAILAAETGHQLATETGHLLATGSS